MFEGMPLWPIFVALIAGGGALALLLYVWRRSGQLEPMQPAEQPDPVQQAIAAAKADVGKFEAMLRSPAVSQTDISQLETALKQARLQAELAELELRRVRLAIQVRQTIEAEQARAQAAIAAAQQLAQPAQPPVQPPAPPAGP